MTILGGASFINILLRIIRTKCLAVVLGPSGIGLLAMFNSITDIAGTVAGLGIDTSGVRQVAEANAVMKQEKVGRTIHALRISAYCLGAAGMVLVILLSSLIGHFTFGSGEYNFDIVLLSSVILLGTVMNGEVALVQGMRRIGDLAKLNILSALYGTVVSIPIIYIWGEDGIVPSLIVVSVLSLVTTWRYAGKIKVPHVQMEWLDVLREARPLISLGVAVMISAVMTKGTMYLISVIAARGIGLDAVGLYQAAVTLSSIYVGFILDSMVKDYIPRLTAVTNDNAACNKLVNEQIEVAVLLSVPGIIATLTFAPMILQLLYTSEFVGAFEILRWQILGILLQVVIWPVCFVLQAKGRGGLFVGSITLSSVVHIGLIGVGISYFGLKGLGMAFLGMWIFYGVLIYGIVKRLTGFAWSKANCKLALVVFPAVGVVFVLSQMGEPSWSMLWGGFVAAGMAVYSIKSLQDTVGPFTALCFWKQSKNAV
jgi:PST family polysaccharide transporter